LKRTVHEIHKWWYNRESLQRIRALPRGFSGSNFRCYLLFDEVQLFSLRRFDWKFIKQFDHAEELSAEHVRDSIEPIC